MGHYRRLGQAITLITAAGFFEDAGKPKDWVTDFFSAIPSDQFLIVISNLQFWDEYLNHMPNVVQLRINELDSEDTKALMTFSAQTLKVEDFDVSDELVRAIGGHPGVANAAVSLARQKGNHILRRDPRQLFNIQQTILGDALQSGRLSEEEKVILDVLSWLPSLGGDLLEEIVVDDVGVSLEKFNESIERLILSCLITPSGYQFSISPAVRQLYRRHNPTPQKTLEAMRRILEVAWGKAEKQGFRDDLFAAFIFMQVLAGKSMPPEFRNLITPGNLHDTVREAYARGKEADDRMAIQQAIAWGMVAVDMKMSESVREEILSTVTRAQIRIRQFADAESTIDIMRDKDYRSVTFLEGHLLRKKRNFADAIPKLRHVVENNRHNRAAVHELALCYRRLHKGRELEELLKEHGSAIGESAVLLDFKVGLDISRNQLASVPADIRRLRSISDQPHSADLRHAQYLMQLKNNSAAITFLSDVIEGSKSGTNRLRALRAYAAARDGNMKVAWSDLKFLKSIPEESARYIGLECEILIADGKPKIALEIHENIILEEPGDWLFRASIYEALANSPDIGLLERKSYLEKAESIRKDYPYSEYDFD